MTPEKYPSINKSLECSVNHRKSIRKTKKIRYFQARKKVKLFGVTVSTNSTEYIAPNDLN